LLKAGPVLAFPILPLLLIFLHVLQLHTKVVFHEPAVKETMGIREHSKQLHLKAAQHSPHFKLGEENT